MEELFREEGQSIFTFKKGEIIIRVEPAKRKDVVANENLGIEVEISTGLDHSFRSPHEFIGVSNNQIYLKSVAGYPSGRLSVCRLDEFSEGWATFSPPQGLTHEEAYKAF